MRIHLVAVSLLAACALSASVAQAVTPSINGLKPMPRVFNDFPTSTATLVTATFPALASVDDRNMTNASGNGANRHDLVLSSDGGATAATFNIADPFTFKTIVNLKDGVNAPRKEAGLRINSPVTGDVLFIINSDAGEIVTFGGGAPFHRFGQNSDGNGYTPGTDILLGMTYDGGASSPRTIHYFIDRDPSTPGTGIESFFDVFSNLEGGPVNFNVAMYAQASPANANDFVTATFTNSMFGVPEPSTIALSMLGLIGIAAFARKRMR